VKEAVIVEALRTPSGRRGGELAGTHPVDLLAHVLRALVERTGVDSGAIDDVIAGCVSQVGEQSLNVARSAALAAGFPVRIPGTTVDRQCGSSQQALAFAAQGVQAGAYACAIACGVESMSRVPLGASFMQGPGAPFGPAVLERFGGRLVDQGESAELVAERWNLTREELDAYSLESHRRAARATDAGRFAAQMVPVGALASDEGIRRDTSLEKLAALRPAFREGGKITAGNSSQISDGAAAMLVCERGFAERAGLRPRARVLASVAIGDDPILMLAAPIPATAMVLERAGLKLDDVGLIEINEAFASMVLAWQRETGAEFERTNVNGGAIALGHPLGATGARLTAVLLAELERRGERYGLQVMCEGGGMANATIFERI
jgi:acetyl-CoA acyltransferase